MTADFRYWLFTLQVIWLQTSGAESVNITTASVTEASSARPTTLYKRIDVPKKEEERTTVDIFGTTRKSRRSKANNTFSRILGQNKWFDWSFWCQEQPRTGHCNESLTKYYYDDQTSQCLTFTYTGCGGGKNRFDRSRDCELFCAGSSAIPFKVDKSSQCSLQPKAGRCLGYFVRYYFDTNERKCKTFVYGGCNGNSNRFQTISECMERCGHKSGNSAENGEEEFGSKAGKDSDKSYLEV